MTISEARTALKKKLVFGDLEQIEALKLLDGVSACKGAILACEHRDSHLHDALADMLDCDCIERWYDPDDLSIPMAALDGARHE